VRRRGGERAPTGHASMPTPVVSPPERLPSPHRCLTHRCSGHVLRGENAYDLIAHLAWRDLIHPQWHAAELRR
jgi:hypothetical protein